MVNIPPAANPAQISAKALAHELFGRRVLGIDYIPRGVMNHKFKVRLLDGEACVIRVYPPFRERVVQYEPDLLKRCETAGFPVPKVVLDSRSGPDVGLSYTVYRWIPGVPLDERLPLLDGKRLVALAQQVVSFLAEFARLEISGYGELVTATQARFGTWAEFLEATVAESSSTAERTPMGMETMTGLLAFGQEAAGALRDRKSVLAWGDVSPENILLDASDRVAGLVDFEGAMAADFSLTLGYCYARYFGTPFFEALRNVWPVKEDQRVLDFYALLRALRLARFAGLQMPTGHPRQSLDQVLPGYREVLKRQQKPQLERSNHESERAKC
jgi:aminoglycoside phosphotransferase (APT) family kinase protein